MTAITHPDYEFLEQAHSQRTSMGLKPSGMLHLGNAMTFLQGVVSIEASQTATLDVMVMDLDFDYQRGHGKGGDFVAYYRKTDWMGCHELVKTHTAEETRKVIGDITAYFGIPQERVRVSQFSDVMEEPRFHEILDLLFGTKDGFKMLKESIMDTGDSIAKLLSPICPDCYHSSTRVPKILDTQDGISVETRCYNSECSTEEYLVNSQDTGTLNFFYLLDPVRDLVPDGLSRTVDLHIFGGDYAQPYGRSKMPKAARVSTLLESIDAPFPTVYVGPVITFEGEKVGKSRDPVYTMEWVRSTQSDWVGRVHAMMKDNPTSRAIELTEMKRYFS